MKSIKRRILLGIIVLFVSGSAYGQIKLNISTDQEYSSNPFRSPVPTESFISSVNFNAEANMDFIKLGYYGNYSSFSAVPERNYYWHQAAMFHQLNRGEIGIAAEQRVNKSESAYFDYTNIMAYYNKLFNIGNYYISINPNVSYTKYDNISILDNYKGSFSFSVNHSTELGITLIAGGGFNYKHYVTPNSQAVITYLNDDDTIDQELVAINNVESLAQVVGFARVAKSLSPTTGLAAQFTNKKNTNLN